MPRLGSVVYMNRFSLLELMTVLAVASVLAALAMPQLFHAQRRAKHAEVKTTVPSLEEALLAYDMAYDWDYSTQTYDGDFNPALSASFPGKAAMPWDHTRADGWSFLEWAPDGDVYCAYDWFTQTSPALNIQVICDVDGDTDAWWESWIYLPQDPNPSWQPMFAQGHRCTNPMRYGTNDCW